MANFCPSGQNTNPAYTAWQNAAPSSNHLEAASIALDVVGGLLTFCTGVYLTTSVFNKNGELDWESFKSAVMTWWVIVLLLLGLGCIGGSIPLWQMVSANKNAVNAWMAARPPACS